MARTKHLSDKKKQLGQFMTPNSLSLDIIDKLNLSKSEKILEPSFGDGSFLIPLIEKFLPLYNGTIEQKLDYVLNYNIWGYEIDQEYYDLCLSKIYQKWNYIPLRHNLYCLDFLIADIRVEFDYIIGNPPFGGTINLGYQNELEKLYGRRNGLKIKKETYSYFIIKSLDLITSDGSLIFICSDTFKTIKTMQGLRSWMITNGSINITSLNNFSDETGYPMVILRFKMNEYNDFILVDNQKILLKSIEKTPNFSWSVDKQLSEMFSDKFIGDFMVCSGGLTTGKNEYFVRDILEDNSIIEEYDFDVFEEEISIEHEISRSKNKKVSISKLRKLKEKQSNGEKKLNVIIKKSVSPKKIHLPHEYYRFYNVATSDILYSKPTKVIFWDNDGLTIRTFKKNGNWYLGGMGGEKFYNKEGMTWQLISSKIKSRYLPNNYIIDNSSPIGILKEGIDKSELYFIIAWTLSDKCNNILKKVLNHTKNIQNKDIERLPYPIWISESNKKFISDLVKTAIDKKINNLDIDESSLISEINKIF